MDDNSIFYKYIVGLTKVSSCQNILIRDVQTIYELISSGYKKNIQNAASRGLTYAYLCMYEIGAKYKNHIPIDAHIRPNEQMKLKLLEYNIDSVIDKLKKTLSPFDVEIKLIDEFNERPIIDLCETESESSDLDTPDLDTPDSETWLELLTKDTKQKPELNDSKKIICLIVTWDKY